MLSIDIDIHNYNYYVLSYFRTTYSTKLLLLRLQLTLYVLYVRVLPEVLKVQF